MPWRDYGELIHLKPTCHLAHPMLRLLPRSRRSLMTAFPAGPRRQPRFKKARAAAVGFRLGAALALSPLVWAQNPPAPGEAVPAPAAPGAGLLPQQRFAPLVQRRVPAVVDIPGTETAGPK